MCFCICTMKGEELHCKKNPKWEAHVYNIMNVTDETCILLLVP